ncbi:MAG TPA: secretin N-terminal domain-containing protein, partial [Candidatus Margulisiibacteriota bacterium]|nr:secretin N-terminal domain-containing protein [Candidatus Margulisiibacteriota bacterium]
MRKAQAFILFIAILFAFSPMALGQDVIVQTEDDKAITIDVKDMEISDVLRMISDQSGLNIVASKNVKGTIAINLQNVPIERALDAILKVNNCGYVKDGNIIQVYTYPELIQKDQFSQLTTRVFRLMNVKATDLKQTLLSLKSSRGTIEVEPKTNSIVATDTKDSLRSIETTIREMDRKLETKVYKLGYAKPADLQKALQGVIPVGEGDLLADDRTNSLVVTAAPVLLRKMDILISNWDKQIPQVLIEAKIIQITLDKNRLLGVEWQYQSPEKYSLTIGTKNIPIPSTATYVDAFKIGVLGATDYQATIHTLENSGDVNLLSSPRIVTLDNKEAKILIGSSEPYDVFTFDAEGHVSGKEVKFIEVGIKLIVTPKISTDGYITMNIHPEVSTAR